MLTNDDRSGALPNSVSSDQQSKPAEVADTATAAAANVASTAASGAKDTAGEVANQAKVVAGEAKRQIGTIVDQTRHELSQQADERTRQAAGGLRTLADQAGALAEGRPDEAGPLSDYLDDARARVATLADRLDTGGPQGLLDDLTGFARRRPMVFLAVAAGVGFAVGRLARAGRAVQQDDTGAGPTRTIVDSPIPTELPAPAPLLDAPLVTTAR